MATDPGPPPVPTQSNPPTPPADTPATGAAVVLVDPHWRITAATATPPFAPLSPSLIDQPLFDALPALTDSPLHAPLRTAMADRRPTHVTGTFPPLAPAGTWVDLHALPTPDGGLALSLHDATPRRSADDELRRLRSDNARLTAAAAAKDQFFAVLSHELRTPLTPVLIAAGALEQDPSIPLRAREEIASLRRNVELEARLIDDLLDLNRITHGKLTLNLQTADLHSLIGHALYVAREDILAKKLWLQMDLRADRHAIRADPVRLQQVLWNLLKNATKFTPEGGTLIVRTRNAHLAPVSPEIPPRHSERSEESRPSDHQQSSLPQGKEPDSASPGGLRSNPATSPSVLVEIQDTGIGIDPAALAHIFTPFEQLTSATRPDSPHPPDPHGGLGLGLAICKALVELHGGSIRAHSAGKGRGATFTVQLPTLPTPSTQSSALSPQSSPSPLATGNSQLATSSPSPSSLAARLAILVVEDHASTADLLARALRSLGHDVATAASLRDATRAASQKPFDLLISDLGLPDGSGLDLLARLRSSSSPSLRGIALTGYGMPDDLRKSAAAGFAAHLTKPITLDHLRSTIARVTTTPPPPQKP